MADRRWSAGETAALIDAWRPLYNRRRGGESDVWVPANQRTRARSTGALATDDWRAVATAVNSFRKDVNLAPNRTHKQCKRRVERLKGWFGVEQLATPSWLGFLCLYTNTAGGRGQSRLRVLSTATMEAHGGDDCCGGAAGGQARGGSAAAVAEGGSAAAEVNGASDGVAVEVEEDDTAIPPSSRPVLDRFTAGLTDYLQGGPIPKKRRTGASTSTSAGAGDGRAPSVKEELVREANARRAPVDEGRAPAGGFAATAPEMAAALGDNLAAGSNDVAVVAKLSEMFKEAFQEVTTLYREVTLERIAVQRQMLAALAATTGGAAVPEPDAAHA